MKTSFSGITPQLTATKESEMRQFDQEVAALLELAMQQPGVADVMKAFESQKATVSAFSAIENATAPKWISSSSTSTEATQVS